MDKVQYVEINGKEVSVTVNKDSGVCVYYDTGRQQFITDCSLKGLVQTLSLMDKINFIKLSDSKNFHDDTNNKRGEVK